jgi:hypothetical protein
MFYEEYLPHANWEEKGADHLPIKSVASYWIPIEVLLMAVVGKSNAQHNFNGKFNGGWRILTQKTLPLLNL